MPGNQWVSPVNLCGFGYRQPGQWSAARTPSLLHTVTGPVTGPASACSRVAVSMGSGPATVNVSRRGKFAEVVMGCFRDALISGDTAALYLGCTAEEFTKSAGVGGSVESEWGRWLNRYGDHKAEVPASAVDGVFVDNQPRRRTSYLRVRPLDFGRRGSGLSVSLENRMNAVQELKDTQCNWARSKGYV